MVAFSEASRRQMISRSGWFWAWALVGFAGLLSILSFGLGFLLIVPTLLAAAFLASNPSARRSASGLITGFGGTLLFVAWLQRSGEHLNPLPWLLIGIAVFAGGIAAHHRG